MNIGAIYKQAKKAVADNAPAILTAIGVTGTITTAVLVGKASFKAAQIIESIEQENKEILDSRERAEAVWKLYVPAVGTGVLTVACIIAANHISTRRAAALVSAYTISQDLFKEYKSKVLEKFGEEKEKEVQEEIIKDRISKTPSTEVIIMSDNSLVLCLDMHSGRYFRSTYEDIKKAENDTNFQILNEDYASLTDFWRRIGLNQTSESDEIGWNTESKLEVETFAVVSDGKPCLGIRFTTVPVRGYYSVY
jgi:hypothetical protein